MFGEYSPYLYVKNGKALITDSISEVITTLGHEYLELDVASVLSLLNFNYICGDRTLIKGVSKVPWHSDVRKDGSVIRRAPIPHDSIVLDEIEIAGEMYNLLSKYLLDNVLNKHTTIWLTLSGGYDSRVIAGIINKTLQKNNIVKVLSWGLENSLDVIYARRIADRYDWEFLYVPFYDGYLEDLIQYAVQEGGAETSPIDYNPIETNNSVLKMIGTDDAIIFAHYGDGIGRGLYQGKHISGIKLKKIHNPYFLFNCKIVQTYKKVIEEDRALAWETDHSNQNVHRIAINELDRHENYMRRMLTKRFKYCNKYDPFTYEDLVIFVYSLSVQCRTTNVYKYLLSELDHYLVELPCANTGISFSGRVENNNKFDKKQHNKSYELLGMYEKVKDVLEGGKLLENNIIEAKALRYLLARWNKDESLGSLVSRLYDIELFIRRFNVNPVFNENDVFHEYAAGLGGRVYSYLKTLKRNFSS